MTAPTLRAPKLHAPTAQHKGHKATKAQRKTRNGFLLCVFVPGWSSRSAVGPVSEQPSACGGRLDGSRVVAGDRGRGAAGRVAAGADAAVGGGDAGAPEGAGADAGTGRR